MRQGVCAKKSGTEFLKIFFTHVPTSWGHAKNMGPNSWKYFAPMNPLVEDMSKIYARPLPRVYAIFLFAIEYSAKAQHTTTGARAPGVAPPPARAPVVVCWALADYSMANRKIAYTLGRGRAYIFDQIPENSLHPCTHYLRTCQKIRDPNSQNMFHPYIFDIFQKSPGAIFP